MIRLYSTAALGSSFCCATVSHVVLAFLFQAATARCHVTIAVGRVSHVHVPSTACFCCSFLLPVGLHRRGGRHGDAHVVAARCS